MQLSLKSNPTFLLLLAHAASSFFLGGCAGGMNHLAQNSPVRIPFTDVVPEHTVAPEFKTNPPHTVAVLPFYIEEKKKQNGKEAEKKVLGQEILRKTFYNYFSTLGYEDINPQDVDRILAGHGIDGNALANHPDWAEIGKMLGADAVITARLNKVSNFTGGIYSETILSGNLEMIDTHTGKVLWTAKHAEANRGGLLMKSSTVVDLVQGEIENSKEKIAFLKVAEEFSRHVVGTIPDIDLKQLESAPASMQQVELAGKGPRIAVMPFRIVENGKKEEKGKKEMAGYLRRRLISNLREKGLKVVEPDQADLVLRQRGLDIVAGPENGLNSDLGKALHADILIYGTLTRLDRQYLVVHSQTLIEVELTMVDAAHGVELNKFRRKQVRNSGLLKIPTGYVSAATAPIMGLDNYYLFDLANNLARDLTEPVVYLFQN